MKWKVTARTSVWVQGRPLKNGEIMEYEGKELPDDIVKWKGAGLITCEPVPEAAVFRGSKKKFEAAVTGKKTDLEVEAIPLKVEKKKETKESD